MDLLHWLLLGYDRSQAIHWTLPPSRHDQANSQVDHLHCDGLDRNDRPSLLLRNIATVHTHQLLLEQAARRVLHQHRHYHRPHVLVQRHLRYL